MKKLDVMDFGANNSDKSFDNAKIIRKLITEAGKTDEAYEISFPRGVYAINDALENDNFIFKMRNIKNVSLKGNGSMLYVKNPFAGVFEFIDSSDISISGFEIKYETAPWTQGEIIEIDEENKTFVFKSEEEYDLISHKRFTNYSAPFGVTLESEYPYNLISESPEHIYFESVAKIAPLTYRMKPKDENHIKNGRIKKHAKLVYTNRTMSGSAVSMFRTKNITVRDMLVHECGDCLFVAAYIEGSVVIDNYRSKLDGNNYIVSNADGVHIQGLRGSIKITNCQFEGLLDDCVNLYHFPAIVKEIISKNKIRAYQAEKNLPRAGEEITFFDSKTREKIATAKVLFVEGKNQSLNECDVTFDREISLNSGDTFFIENVMFSDSVIKNNIFKNCRRYGLLLKSKNTAVENNTFENLGGDAINFTADVTDKNGREGPYAYNVTIKNNYIHKVCYMDSRKKKTPWASGGAIGIYKGNRDIKISDNLFKDNPCDSISFYDDDIFIG